MAGELDYLDLSSQQNFEGSQILFEVPMKLTQAADGDGAGTSSVSNNQKAGCSSTESASESGVPVSNNVTGQDGSAGGGGGDDDGNDNHEHNPHTHDAIEDDTEHHEPSTENSTPSSSLEEAVPEMIQPPSSYPQECPQTNLPVSCNIEETLQAVLETCTQDGQLNRSQEDVHNTSRNMSSEESEGMGGISGASTAIVTDEETHRQIHQHSVNFVIPSGIPEPNSSLESTISTMSSSASEGEQIIPFSNNTSSNEHDMGRQVELISTQHDMFLDAEQNEDRTTPRADHRVPGIPSYLSVFGSRPPNENRFTGLSQPLESQNLLDESDGAILEQTPNSDSFQLELSQSELQEVSDNEGEQLRLTPSPCPPTSMAHHEEPLDTTPTTSRIGTGTYDSQPLFSLRMPILSPCDRPSETDAIGPITREPSAESSVEIEESDPFDFVISGSGTNTNDPQPFYTSTLASSRTPVTSSNSDAITEQQQIEEAVEQASQPPGTDSGMQPVTLAEVDDDEATQPYSLPVDILHGELPSQLETGPIRRLSEEDTVESKSADQCVPHTVETSEHESAPSSAVIPSLARGSTFRNEELQPATNRPNTDEPMSCDTAASEIILDQSTISTPPDAFEFPESQDGVNEFTRQKQKKISSQKRKRAFEPPKGLSSTPTDEELAEEENNNTLPEAYTTGYIYEQRTVTVKKKCLFFKGKVLKVLKENIVSSKKDFMPVTCASPSSSTTTSSSSSGHLGDLSDISKSASSNEASLPQCERIGDNVGGHFGNTSGGDLSPIMSSLPNSQQQSCVQTPSLLVLSSSQQGVQTSSSDLSPIDELPASSSGHTPGQLLKSGTIVGARAPTTSELLPTFTKPMDVECGSVKLVSLSEIPSSKKISLESSQDDTPQPSTSMSDNHVRIQAGTQVMAKWKDGFYYPGKILFEDDDGKFVIHYEDNDLHAVEASELIAVSALHIGQQVMAWVDDEYIQGEITNVDDVETVTYTVKLHTGIVDKFTRSKVILTKEQSKTIPKPVVATVPIRSLGKVTLDNLVHGKRRRRPKILSRASSKKTVEYSKTPKRTQIKSTVHDVESNYTTVSGEETPFAGPSKIGRRGRLKLKKTKLEITTTEGSKKIVTRKRKMSTEPTATSTPSLKKMKTQASTSHDMPENSSTTTGSSSSDTKSRNKSPKMSPRKPQPSIDDARGPIPSDGSTLFMGFGFLLTHGRTEKPRAGSLEFEKDHIRRQMINGGGVLLEKFDAEQVAEARQVVLVSDTHQRTVKYLHCLAAGIPLVSHHWIIECCKLNKVLDFRKYLLPAGTSLDNSNTIVERDACVAKPLSNIRVMVASSDKAFKETWTAIAVTAGSSVIMRIPKGTSPPEMECPQFIVTDAGCPAATIHRAENLSIPLVSSEWVIQTLVYGKVQSFDGHPNFYYKFQRV